MNEKEVQEAMEERQERKEFDPFGYVTIKVSEYRKLIKKVERVKAENEALKQVAEIKEKADNYRQWWQEEMKKADKFKKDLDEAYDVIAGYKETLKNELDIEEKEKLADLAFEKGVANVEQS